MYLACNRNIKELTIRSVFLFLLLVSGLVLYSQNFDEEELIEIERLNAIITEETSHDTLLVRTYVQLSEILYVNDIDTVKYLCEKAIDIAEAGLKDNPSELEKNSFKNHMASAYLNLGYYYGKKGDITEQLSFINKSINIQEEIGNEIGVADCLINMGRLRENQGNIPEALDDIYRSLAIYEKIDEKKGIAISLNNLAEIFETQGDYEKALEFYFQSLEIREKYLDKIDVAKVLNNIGYNYGIQGNDSLSLVYYERSLKLREELAWDLGVARTLVNIGYVYYERMQYDQALAYFNKALLAFEKEDDKESMAYALISIGMVLHDQGNIQEAKKYAERSLELSEEIGFPDNIQKAAKLLSEINEFQNKGMQALYMHKLYITMRDSINNEETQRANARQQAKYEYETKKAIDDAEHEKEIAIEKEAKEKQRIIIASIAGILLLVVAFLLFIFNRLKITRKQKTVIETQKIEVEKQRDVINTVHKEITDSISYAQRIQRAILPPNRIVKEYLPNSFILYEPKDVVAGDFYWLRHVEGKTIFAAADCTGHGVPGAMVSVVCNNALNRSVREYGLTDPGLILDQTRGIVVREFEKSEEEVKDGMDISLCTIEGNVLQYAGAYNPLWIIRNGELIEIKANRQPIGLSRDPKPFTTHTFLLEENDMLYIFTDGYADQFGGELGKKFKSLNFKKRLLSIGHKDLEAQRQFLFDSFEEWRGELEQVDDVCVIGVKFLSTP